MRSYLPLYPPCLTQCLAHRRCQINICSMIEEKKNTWIEFYPYPFLHVMFYFNLITILKVVKQEIMIDHTIASLLSHLPVLQGRRPDCVLRSSHLCSEHCRTADCGWTGSAAGSILQGSILCPCPGPYTSLPPAGPLPGQSAAVVGHDWPWSLRRVCKVTLWPAQSLS